jgi:nucleotide-binding universal stress UspA family protein
MKKILCLIDFSTTSIVAAQLAALMAGRSGGLLTLLHVVHIPLADTTETALMAGQLLDEQKTDAEEKLENIRRLVLNRVPEGTLRAESLNCVVVEALLTDAVVQMTTQDGYNLVVMGKTGLDFTLEEVLLGSNTQSVINHVHCPVVAFPAEAPRNPIRTIIYATDYHQSDVYGLSQVKELADLVGAGIRAVHITDKPKKASSEAAADFARRLRQEGPLGDLILEEYIAEDEEEGLQEYVQSHQGDMLAVLKKEEGFFTYLFRQSLTDRLAYHAHLPLLVVYERTVG